VEWGKPVEMTRECGPDDRWAGGVPVVVRDRESLLHGEEEQFKKLGSELLDRN